MHFHGLIERQIFLVHEDRGAGDLMQFAETADVVDVCMSADDGFHGKLVASEQICDAGYFIAGIDDEGFAGEGIADDRAIALQHAHGDGEADQFARGDLFGFREL